jgi:hypothetical protein
MDGATLVSEPAPVPRVPHSRLLSVQNLTPFAKLACHKMAPGRRFHETIVLKGAFELMAGKMRPADPRGAPIIPADAYWDPSAGLRASVREAGDVLLLKPATDVIVTGAARAPGGRPSASWQVAVVVRTGDAVLLRHELTVTGPRHFVHRALRGWTVSDPEPASEVPIRYELAYGGAYPDPERRDDSAAWLAHEANPSGLGFCDVAALDRDREHPAPQWELPAHPVTGPGCGVPLAGLGPVARHWESRRRFAGTYDEAWQRDMREGLERRLTPDYAPDFDVRFFQCAHPALTTASPLRGDEWIGLGGLLEADLMTQLPGLSVRASVSSGRPPWRELALPLDTVHFDLEASRVSLSWRLSIPQEDDVRAVILYVEGEDVG